jgi:hypothetical protein
LPCPKYSKFLRGVNHHHRFFSDFFTFFLVAPESQVANIGILCQFPNPILKLSDSVFVDGEEDRDADE